MFKGLLLVFNKNHELQRETQENLQVEHTKQKAHMTEEVILLEYINYNIRETSLQFLSSFYEQMRTES